MRTNTVLRLVISTFLLAASVAAAQQSQQGARGAPETPPLILTSPAFTDSSQLPLQYSCSNTASVSPPLRWSDVPKGTASFALMLHELEPSARQADAYMLGAKIPVSGAAILHWMIWNIPGNATSLPKGVPPELADLPNGARQSQPGRPDPGYRRPCPQGLTIPHHYTFELFALDQKLDLPVGAGQFDLLKVMDGHILGHAVLVGLLSCPVHTVGLLAVTGCR
jgi:Raf kinase inhibitor-like YbhB/YbcL family protein